MGRVLGKERGWKTRRLGSIMENCWWWMGLMLSQRSPRIQLGERPAMGAPVHRCEARQNLQSQAMILAQPTDERNVSVEGYT